MYNFIFTIGSTAINIAGFIAGYTRFAFRVLLSGGLGSKLFNPAVFMVAARQIYFTGVELIGIVTLTSIILGIALVGGLNKFLIILGAKESLGTVLTLAIVRSAAPFVCGLLIVLRTSTAIIMEIGLMKYNRELTSLEAMNIDPYAYVYFPRVIAGMVGMVALATYFSIISIVGSYTFLGFKLETTLDSIMRQVITEINLSDVGSFVFQTVAIGFVATSIPIYTALETKHSQIDIVKSFVYGMIRLFFAFVLIILAGTFI